jgi:succinate dehydrogenase/fumarate reductase iron-sulfur protein
MSRDQGGSRAGPGDDPHAVRATIFRYEPGVDAAPRYETFEVPYARGMRVLDVLEAIREDLGHSIAGVKKCGLCAMTVNGRPCLTCWEPAERDMTIEPLKGFPVIRDLVVDRSADDERFLEVEPFLYRRADRPYPGLPEPLTAGEMRRAATMMNCIECLMCVAACPVPADRFVGPAALVQLARWAFDPRDGRDRGALAIRSGIRECADCGDCTAVCPAGIPVKEMAIAGLREVCAARGYPDAGPPAHPQCGPASETTGDKGSVSR